jgi:hypothetical protein
MGRENSLGKALLNVRHAAVIFQNYNGSGKFRE